jgi:hypothetical protein
MALITKSELMERTKLVNEIKFGDKHHNFLTQMQNAADNGEYFVTFEVKDLSDEFIVWLYKEKFRVCGLNDTEFKNFWECIDDPNYVGAYRTIKISWES